MFDSLTDLLKEEQQLAKICDIANHLQLILDEIEQDQLKEGADRNKAIDAIISILAQQKKFDRISLTRIQSCCC